jgi:hypothetical protein
MIKVDNIPKPNNDFLYGLSERYTTVLILHLIKEEAFFFFFVSIQMKWSTILFKDEGEKNSSEW